MHKINICNCIFKKCCQFFFSMQFWNSPKGKFFFLILSLFVILWKLPFFFSFLLDEKFISYSSKYFFRKIFCQKLTCVLNIFVIWSIQELDPTRWGRKKKALSSLHKNPTSKHNRNYFLIINPFSKYKNRIYKKKNLFLKVFLDIR